MKKVQKTEKGLDFETELKKLEKKRSKKEDFTEEREQIKQLFADLVEELGGKDGIDKEVAKSALLATCREQEPIPAGLLEEIIEIYTEVWGDVFGLTETFPEKTFAAGFRTQEKGFSSVTLHVAMVADGLEESYRDMLELGMPEKRFAKEMAGTLSLTVTPERLRETIYEAVKLLWGRLGLALPFPAQKIKHAISISPTE